MYQKGFIETYIDINHLDTFHVSTVNKVKIIFKTYLPCLKKIFKWTLKSSKKSDEVSRKSAKIF